MEINRKEGKSMKWSKLLCFGLAAALSCASLPQMPAYAQEAAWQEEIPEGNKGYAGEESLGRMVTESEGSAGELEEPLPEALPRIVAGQDTKAANTTEEDFKYQELDDGTLEITEYKGSAEELVVPAEIDGKQVTSIGFRAFDGCSSLTGIQLPKGLTTIGTWAFDGCSSLTGIQLPKGLTTIGQSAFYGCKSLTLVVVKGSYAETYAKENGLKYKYACTHNYKFQTSKATTKKNGERSEVCTKCGDIKSKTTIYAAKVIKLSKTSYTYNGKAQKPSVSIKDSKGKALKEKTDYAISYAKGRKNVGVYTVGITFKGNYTGTIKKTFTIAPKPTSISKLAPKKKGFALKWKKQDKQTTGYEIAYSTSKKFTGKTTSTATVGKNKTTSKSIGKLKAKKKYYVRIRTYKDVKTSGKTKKIYSGWSKLRSVTTKK